MAGDFLLGCWMCGMPTPWATHSQTSHADFRATQRKHIWEGDEASGCMTWAMDRWVGAGGEGVEDSSLMSANDGDHALSI
jgi:hypothetical protein